MSSEADHVVEGFFDSLSRQSTGSLDSTQSIRDLVQAEILYHIFFSQCSFSKINVYHDISLSIITLKTTENCFFKPELYQEKNALYLLYLFCLQEKPLECRVTLFPLAMMLAGRLHLEVGHVRIHQLQRAYLLTKSK